MMCNQPMKILLLADRLHNFARKRKSDQQLAQRPAPSPPPTVAHMAASITSNDIAKLVAEQVSAQFQAHMATFQHYSPAGTAEPMDCTDW